MQLIARHSDDTFDLLLTHDEAVWSNNAMLHSSWMDYADVRNTIKTVCNAYGLAHMPDGVIALKGVDPVCRLTRRSLQHILSSIDRALKVMPNNDFSAIISNNRRDVEGFRASLAHTLSDLGG